MVTFKPVRSYQGWYGLLACLILLGVDGVLLWLLLQYPVSGLSFVLVLAVLLSLALLVYLAYRTWGCFSLRYRVTRDGVTIVWGPLRQAVPLGHITRIVRGGLEAKKRSWHHWPGPYASVRGESALGPWISFATRHPREQMLLVTAEATYGITPAQAERFLKVLQERHLLGPTRTLPSEPRWPSLWGWRFWRDRLALGLLLAGLVLALALFGFLAFRFPSLPAEVVLHFGAAGEPDRVGPRQGLFLLPLIALLTWVINASWGGAVYRRQRLAAYLLWGGTIGVQIIAGLALGSLMP
jgi:hypothetical protein